MIQRYALGCSFNISDLFFNFPYKKLKLNCRGCLEITGDAHRSLLVKKIFLASMKIVIQDIVERNVTFWLPLTGDKKCNMHMKRVSGKDFQKLRQAGKWDDIDIVNSNFSGYEIGFYMLGKRTPRVKTVYVNKQTREAISRYTNMGKQYGDGNIDTKISDYYPQIYRQFPEVPQEDIKRILTFAWKSVYLHNSYGGDLLISGDSMWYYIGNLRKSSLQHFHYYIRKLITKIRIAYRREGSPWKGYYYFALSDTQYENYLLQKNKKGRPRKKFTFGQVFMYEILDECRLNEHSKKYIFRIPSISPIKLKYFVAKLEANAELIETRSPLKFKDILVNDNEYEFL